MNRANTWMKNNTEIELKSCETVTWASTNMSQVNDTNVVLRSKSFSSHMKTKYLRGLRCVFGLQYTVILRYRVTNQSALVLLKASRPIFD